MKIRFLKLQDNDNKAKKLRLERLPEGWNNIKEVLHHQNLPYIPKVIRLELINWHYENLLIGYFNIRKTLKLIARKYYWLTLQKDIEAYVKGCNIYLALKTVCHKLYGDL